MSLTLVTDGLLAYSGLVTGGLGAAAPILSATGDIMKLSIKTGVTSQSINVFIQNSSSTTGAGLTGFAPAGGSLLSGMICYYSFTGTSAASVAQALSVPAAVNSAFSAGQIVEIDATHMPGWARLDLPNAALAGSSGRCVSLLISGGTNVAPCPIEIELTGWDNQDAVHGGMSSLPNVASGSTGAIPTTGTGANQIQVDGAGNAYANLAKILGTAVSTPATNGVLDVNVKNIGGTVTAGAAGYVGVDWGHVNAPTTTVGLSGTTVGTVTTVTTATNLTNAPTAGDLTATMKTSVTTAATAATPTASLNLAQTLSAFGSALLSSTSDTALTVNEALHCAVAAVGGQQTTSGTAYTTKTSAGTTIRAFTLDQNPNPNNRS